MPNKIRRRGSDDSTEQLVKQGLLAMREVMSTAKQINLTSEEMRDEVLERLDAIEAAIEVNFWVNLRVAHTGELEAFLDGPDASSGELVAHVSWLREQFLATLAVAHFLRRLGADPEEGLGDSAEE